MGSIYTQEEAIRLFGIEQEQIGEASGKAEGEAIGLVNGAIETCKNFGKSMSDTVEYILANYNISREDAMDKVNQYWDNKSK